MQGGFYLREPFWKPITSDVQSLYNTFIFYLWTSINDFSTYNPLKTSEFFFY